MDYEKAYKDALERAREIHNEHRAQCFDVMVKVFPELKESKDERIRKELISLFQDCIDGVNHSYTGSDSRRWLAWLEKQGEQKPVSKTEPIVEGLTTEFQKQVSHLIASVIDKEYEYTKGYVEWVAQSLLIYAKNEQTSTNNVEPKFKVGDFIISKHNSDIVYKITGIGANESHEPEYVCEYVGRQEKYVGRVYNMNQNKVDSNFETWTIQDAKDGDVLAFNDGHGNDCIELIKSITGKKIEFWFCLTNGNDYEVFDGITPYTNFASREDATPATTEQRDLLFQKMKESGYEWNVVEKKLKKIEQKTTWSEEDEKEVAILEAYIRSEDWSDRHIDRALGIVDELVKKLKSIKEVVQPQPKQEWSEEDERLSDAIYQSIDFLCLGFSEDKLLDWFKSLKERMKGE